jgi:hypothetical protein
MSVTAHPSLANHWRDGYVIIDLKDKSPVDRMRKELCGMIAKHLGTAYDPKLTTLLQRSFSDKEYSTLLQDLNDNNPNIGCFRAIFEELKGLFVPVLGENLATPKVPRVRFVLPNDPRATFDMHSDTFYGDSFFDMAFWVQLTPGIDIPSLSAIPGSHLPKGGEYKVKSAPPKMDPAHTKGKSLGLPYDPKIVDFDPKNVKDLVVPYGSVFVFFASLLHASHPHTMTIPRLSSDLRVTPLLVPSAFRKNRPGYFTPLYVTPEYRRILDCYPIPESEYL